MTEEQKTNLMELIKLQLNSLNDDYNAGLLNGLILAYNSSFEENHPYCCYNSKTKEWRLDK